MAIKLPDQCGRCGENFGTESPFHCASVQCYWIKCRCGAISGFSLGRIRFFVRS